MVGDILPRVWQRSGLQWRNSSTNEWEAITVWNENWQTLDDVARNLLFRPLGMDDSKYVSLADVFKIKGMGTVRGGGATLQAVRRLGTVQSGGVTLETTANDFAKFLVMMLNLGQPTCSKHPTSCRDPSASSTSDVRVGIALRRAPRPPYDDVPYRIWGGAAHAYLTEAHFNEWVRKDQLHPNAARGEGFGFDTFGGHSFVGQVSMNTGVNVFVSPKDAPCSKKAKAPLAFRHHEPLSPRGFARQNAREDPRTLPNTLGWRGSLGSAWEIDFSKKLAFVNITRNWCGLIKNAACAVGSMMGGQKYQWKVARRARGRQEEGRPGLGAAFEAIHHTAWTGGVGDVFDAIEQVRGRSTRFEDEENAQARFEEKREGILVGMGAESWEP